MYVLNAHLDGFDLDISSGGPSMFCQIEYFFSDIDEYS